MAWDTTSALALTKQVIRTTFLSSSLIALVTSSAFAEMRRECELNINQNTKLAIGAGGGSLIGTVFGASACSAFLAAAPVDIGLSAGLCLALATFAATVGGTAIAEASVNEELRQCAAKRPE